MTAAMPSRLATAARTASFRSGAHHTPPSEMGFLGHLWAMNEDKADE
jgi:hypothetical protein